MTAFAEREFDCKELGEEETESQQIDSHLKNGFESREDCRQESNESKDRQIETQINVNRLLRTSDSDEESTSDSVINKIGFNSKQQKESNESQSVGPSGEPKTTIVVSSNSTGDSLSKTDIQLKKRDPSPLKSRTDQKPRNYKTGRVKSTKWGESVGITDSKGRPKRLVSLSEVKNYIPLKMRYKSEFKFYFSLIESRYPQRFKGYGSEKQRWRMRYNVFVDGLFDSSKKYDCILHVGEIIIYFDIARKMSHPYYANCSFYANYGPLEKTVDTTKLTRLIFRLHDVLTSKLMLQLKFPVEAKTFKNTDHLYFKFLLRQKELMDELAFIQNKQWAQTSKWLTIESKRGNRADKGLTFDRLAIERKSEPNRRTDDQREQRARTGEESQRNRLNTGNRLTSNPSEEFQNQRVEDRVDRRFSASNNRRRRNLSNRRQTDQTFVANSLRETASDFSQMWVDDRNLSKNLPQKTTQRRNRNNDRMDAQNTETARPLNQAFRGARREESRSRPKTRRR